MNPLYWSFRLRCLLGLVICAGLLGFALYAQYVMGMNPCPLCIFQRIPFAAMALVFLAGALHGPRAQGRWGYAVPVVVLALAGAAVSIRHLWIQSLPPDQIPTCGPDLGYMLGTFPLSKVLKMVLTGSGECAKVETILGVPMPGWALLWFVLLAAWAIVAAAARRSR